MNEQFFDRVDWQRPWLAPYRAIADLVMRFGEWRATLNALAAERALHNHRGLPIRFVSQTSLPPGTAYEAFISVTGNVPTRDNLHDFFNALVWLIFPRIKARLNALHAGEMEKICQGEGSHRTVRGKVRDAATIFDENAALLIVRNIKVLDSLRAHCWTEVFVDRRDRFWADCDIVLFGHALMEKLVDPYKAITAHAFPVCGAGNLSGAPEQSRFAELDLSVARQIEAGLHCSTFTPLPVLGIPGWWKGQDAGFYGDATVFRPKQQNKVIQR